LLLYLVVERKQVVIKRQHDSAEPQRLVKDLVPETGLQSRRGTHFHHSADDQAKRFASSVVAILEDDNTYRDRAACSSAAGFILG